MGDNDDDKFKTYDAWEFTKMSILTFFCSLLFGFIWLITLAQIKLVGDVDHIPNPIFLTLAKIFVVFGAFELAIAIILTIVGWFKKEDKVETLNSYSIDE